MIVTIDAIRSVPLFSGMTGTSIEAVSAVVEPTEYADGEPIVRQGEAGDIFVVILGGHARVDQDGATIRELHDGDFLGEISLIDGRARTATVTAAGTVQALVIRRDGFFRLFDSLPTFRLEVLLALTDRLRRMAPDPLA
jgi:CRP/FNR family cyclic AMP-dependent transcriptional regulator